MNITRPTHNRPSMFQIQEAIRANICPPDADEQQDLTISKYIRASVKREGDSQLGLLLFVGISKEYNYSFNDISSIASLEYEEYRNKLAKYSSKVRLGNKRFVIKVKLIKNYLRFEYGA